MHILMADDDKDDFYILKEAAEKVEASCKISYAANWIELWRQILKGVPDLVFLDLNMPVKTGLECLQSLRNDPKCNAVPIIIYSTSVSRHDIDSAYEHGANYFVVKPNSIDEIALMVKRICAMGKEALLAIPPREEFVMI